MSLLPWLPPRTIQPGAWEWLLSRNVKNGQVKIRGKSDGSGKNFLYLQPFRKEGPVGAKGRRNIIGMWRSWLAHHVRDVGVVRSSRIIPTRRQQARKPAVSLSGCLLPPIPQPLPPSGEGESCLWQGTGGFNNIPFLTLSS